MATPPLGDCLRPRAWRFWLGADVVFPLIHGPTGEDGTLQGLLEMLEIPYVGSGVLASAACMDKVVSKQILADNNIPQVRFCGLTPDDIDTPSRCEASAERVAKTLKGPPWFVKPANMGSSVGIAKVRTQADLPAAFRQARGYDRRVIVEEGLVGVRELELGILGNDAPQASSIGEITYDAEFYDYATKYTDGRAQLHLPAALEGHVVDKIQHLARKAYRALNCAGMARVDFFYLPQSQEIYLNELNTCPGFTQYSMFPSVWRHSGLPLRQLVERLVTLAQEEAAATGPLRRATLAHLHA